MAGDAVGLRVCRQGRRELRRRTQTVETPHGPLRVKVVTLPSGRTRAHAEWEDVRALAERAGIPAQAIVDDLPRWLP